MKDFSFKFCFVIFVLTCYSYAVMQGQELTPVNELQLNGSAEDFLIDGDFMYTGGSAGELYLIDLKSRQIVKSLKLPEISDFMGDPISPKIICIDKDLSNGSLILVSQGQRGYRNVYVVENWKIRQVIHDTDKKWMISKARVAKPDHIIIALLSNELIMFNYATGEIEYQEQVGFYTLSDMDMNSAKTEIITGDESGVIYRIQLADGKILKRYNSEHVDKVNKIAFSNKVIAGGGQDQRLSVYQKDSGMGWHMDSGFLVFSLGIDDDGNWLVFNADESNALSLFNVKTKQITAKLTGHNSIVTQSEFMGNKLITCGEGGKICWWDISSFNN